ncbi:response regulator [Alicycliphilus denitrificans]|uniref:response regulator n=1 Tax=Alicycliphilus denitrificans TaxID=179636 RepID=UPI0038504C7D
MPKPPELPCVLLLEDDAAVRRFIELALYGLPLELQACARLTEARALLARTPVQLVLADLHLPDGSGLEMLDELRAQGQHCPLVVISGAVDDGVRRQLLARGVAQVLPKPVAVDSLVAAVRLALAGTQALEAPASGAAPAPAPATPEPTIDALGEFFAGQQALYDAWRATSLPQLPRDLAEGDAAARAGDAPALRRVAHNLKTALTMFGQGHAAQLARATEEHAAQGAQEAMQLHWQRLRQQVRAWLAQQPRT